MSLGLQALRRICEEQSLDVFRQLRDELFTDSELAAYHYVRRFLSRRGVLPTPDYLRENNLYLTPASGPASEYVDRMRTRQAQNRVAARHPEWQQAMDQRDMPRVLSILDEMRRDILEFEFEQDVVTLADAFEEVLSEFNEARMHPDRTGFTTGWRFLDGITGGMQPGDVFTLVARPNEGKSWLLLHQAYRAWLRGHSILLVSMEMQVRQMARRMLGLTTGINPEFIRRGHVSRWAQEYMVDTVEGVAGFPPFHLVSGSFKKSVSDVDVLIQEFNPDGVYVDAGYLLRTENRGSRYSRHEVLADVGEDLKRVALTRNKPLFQTVQFNRSAMKDQAGGGLANIGGTDVIGQVSSIVVGIKPGIGGRETTARRLDLLKNREGEKDNTNFINFLFTPIDFRHAPDLDDVWRQQNQTAAEEGADSEGIRNMQGRPGNVRPDPQQRGRL